MTRKERAEIYLKAAELIDKKAERYCCFAIQKGSGKSYHERIKESEFEEFFLFKPLDIDCIIWFKISEFDYMNSWRQQARITALLFASEMCK